MKLDSTPVKLGPTPVKLGPPLIYDSRFKICAREVRHLTHLSIGLCPLSFLNQEFSWLLIAPVILYYIRDILAIMLGYSILIKSSVLAAVICLVEV